MFFKEATQWLGEAINLPFMLHSRRECFHIIFLQMGVNNLILDLLLEFDGQNKRKALQPRHLSVSFYVLYVLTAMHQYIL